MSSPTSSIAEAVASGRQALALDAAMIAKLTDMVGDFAINLSIALLILIATIVASKWAARGMRRLLGRSRAFQNDPTVLSFAAQVARVVVMIIGLIAVLQRLGVQTTSIIAVLGAASLAVGLALQGTLSNVAAGVMLLVLRPYRVGDVIDIAGAVGTVQRLDLFTTQLSNANNHKIVVPNSKVLGDVIINLTGQKTRRIEIPFTVGYSTNLKQARAVIAGVADANPTVLADPEPWSGVTNLLDSSVEITLHAWVKVDDWWHTKSDLTQSVKEALDAAGIEIPFPHQVDMSYAPPKPGPDPVEPRKTKTKDKAPEAKAAKPTKAQAPPQTADATRQPPSSSG